MIVSPSQGILGYLTRRVVTSRWKTGFSSMAGLRMTIMVTQFPEWGGSRHIHTCFQFLFFCTGLFLRFNFFWIHKYFVAYYWFLELFFSSSNFCFVFWHLLGTFIFLTLLVYDTFGSWNFFSCHFSISIVFQFKSLGFFDTAFWLSAYFHFNQNARCFAFPICICRMDKFILKL